jgi:mRNA interferase MazF
MPICSRGDVVTVPFPFIDTSQSKRRPALVLSSSAFNEKNGHVLLAMITTTARSSWPSDHRIRDLVATGLPHASVIRWKVFTLPVHLIVNRLGALAKSEQIEVDAALAEIIRT